MEATARKVAEAYTQAERRIGSGDVPPKTAAEYKVNVPEALASHFTAADLEKNAGFRSLIDGAHAKAGERLPRRLGGTGDAGDSLQVALPHLLEAVEPGQRGVRQVVADGAEDGLGELELALSGLRAGGDEREDDDQAPERREP